MSSVRAFGLSTLVAALMLSGASSNVLAQGTAAALSGTVKDDTGAVLPGATIVVRNTDTVADSRELITDTQGDFSAPNLPPGPYESHGLPAGVRDARAQRHHA